MINTMASSISQPTDSEDLNMQIIHAGSSEMVDDTINVLQEMLARSNELIKVQRNFMNEFGM